MNILHLLWAVPLSASFGFMVCAVLMAGRKDDDIEDWR